MQVDPRMYDRPMTEDEKRLMMIQGLKGNNMMMADASLSPDFTTGNLSVATDKFPVVKSGLKLASAIIILFPLRPCIIINLFSSSVMGLSYILGSTCIIISLSFFFIFFIF